MSAIDDVREVLNNANGIAKEGYRADPRIAREILANPGWTGSMLRKLLDEIDAGPATSRALLEWLVTFGEAYVKFAQGSSEVAETGLPDEPISWEDVRRLLKSIEPRPRIADAQLLRDLALDVVQVVRATDDDRVDGIDLDAIINSVLKTRGRPEIEEDELKALRRKTEADAAEIKKLNDIVRAHGYLVPAPTLPAAPPSPERIAEIRALVRHDFVAERPFGLGVEIIPHMTIEAHGDGEALYIDRGDSWHGLNIVHLTEPAHQWPAVRAWLLALPSALRDAVTALTAAEKRNTDVLRAVIRAVGDHARDHHRGGCEHGCSACLIEREVEELGR